MNVWYVKESDTNLNVVSSTMAGAEDEGRIALENNGLPDLTGKSEAEIKASMPSNDAASPYIRLALEMDKNDIVVLRDSCSEHLIIGIVTSDYSYDSTNQAFPHERKVKWLFYTPASTPHAYFLSNRWSIQNISKYIEDVLFMIHESNRIIRYISETKI